MKSPCNKVCVIDPDSSLCRGCFRTLDEIGRWGEMTDAERDAVMSLLRKRKDSGRSDVAEAPVPPLA